MMEVYAAGIKIKTNGSVFRVNLATRGTGGCIKDRS